MHYFLHLSKLHFATLTNVKQCTARSHSRPRIQGGGQWHG